MRVRDRRRRPGPLQRGLLALAATALAASLVGVGTAAALQTDVKPFYTEPRVAGSPYDFTPLLSTGDRVPRTGDPSQTVQMPTMPDGLGALERGRRSGEFVAGNADFSIFMNHEHRKSVNQDLVLGDGVKLQGAIISLLQIDRRRKGARVQSGDLAYERVFDTAAGTSHAPSTDINDPAANNAFARFCSGYLARDYRAYGFDRPIYFTGEEGGGNSTADTYDERGGIAVALFEHRGERQLRTIPALGHFRKESVVPVAGYPGKTVLLGLEDGPAAANDGYDSQLYMYVGNQRTRSSDPMKRNGLAGGDLYALGLASGADERDYERGKRRGSWRPIAGAEALDDAGLEATARSAGAFGFHRLEDGDQDGRRNVVFATLGGESTAPFESTLRSDQAGAYYGRLYTMAMSHRRPHRAPWVRIGYDADEAVSSADAPDYRGGNALVSMDNLSLSPNGYLVVQEDATGYGDEFMAERGRDAQIWRFEVERRRHHRGLRLHAGSGIPIAESECVYGGGRAGTCDDSSDGTDNGTWESSGIIDADHVLPKGSFLFDVQAHDQDTPFPREPDYGVDDEDGQLILLTPASAGSG